MHRYIHNLSRGMAIAGGIVLSIIVIMVVISVIGRELNSFLHGDFFDTNMTGFAQWLLDIRLPGIWGDLKIGPVNGDYEMLEAMVAFAIFAFLPLAQLTYGHATVDIFTSWMPERTQRIITMVSDILFALVMVIIAIKLFEGTLNKQSRGQTTFLLQFPIWWAYAVSCIGAISAAIVAVYLAVMRTVEVFTGRNILPHTHEGAEA